MTDLAPELATLVTLAALAFRLSPRGRRLAPRGYRTLPPTRRGLPASTSRTRG